MKFVHSGESAMCDSFLPYPIVRSHLDHRDLQRYRANIRTILTSPNITLVNNMYIEDDFACSRIANVQ